ncbi:hypothetical protein C8R46DRAFT_548428 [Mycena filopes]|nr:hypothetical protein C8R46DRAFT_548428 [Mycena filopes]
MIKGIDVRLAVPNEWMLQFDTVRSLLEFLLFLLLPLLALPTSLPPRSPQGLAIGRSCGIVLRRRGTCRCRTIRVATQVAQTPSGCYLHANHFWPSSLLISCVPPAVSPSVSQEPPRSLP